MTAGSVAAALAASMLFVAAVASAQTPGAVRSMVAPSGVVSATLAPSQPHESLVDADRVGEPAATTAAKREAASSPTSSRFVLLGLGVVLVGVLARQRRGFRRSGTILLR